MPSKRVLIADDAMDFGRMLQASFATLDASLKVSLVPSAEEALLETSRLSPDLLVTDVRLPGMSGLELLRKVHARYPSVRVMVVTGLKDPALEGKFLEAGADCFFVKPLSMEAFLDAAGRLLAAQPGQPHKDVPAVGQKTDPTPPVTHSSGGTGRLRRVTPERAAEMIAALRQTLNARQVVLADTRGEVITRAGDFDATFESDAIPRALAALQSSKGMAGLVGGSPQTVLACKGKELELVIAPAGDLALIIGLRAGRTQLRLSLAIEEALNFQKECGGLLPQAALRTLAEPVEANTTPPRPSARTLAEPVEAKPAPPARTLAEPAKANIATLRPPAQTLAEPVEAKPARTLAEPVEASPAPADLGDLENLFHQPRPAAPADLNDFWERALDSAGEHVASPDVISYEQARKLGLHLGTGKLHMPGSG